MITNPTDSNSTGGTSSYFWSAEQALAIADGEYFEVGLFCGGTGKSAARRLSDSTSDFIAELKLPEKVIAINAMGGNLDYVVEGEGKQNLDQIWSNNEPLPIFRRVVEFPEGW
jgi:hypothetical protein